MSFLKSLFFTNLCHYYTQLLLQLVYSYHHITVLLKVWKHTFNSISYYYFNSINLTLLWYPEYLKNFK